MGNTTVNQWLRNAGLKVVKQPRVTVEMTINRTPGMHAEKSAVQPPPARSFLRRA